MDRGVWRLSSRSVAGVLLLAASVSLWQVAMPAGVEAVQSDLSFVSSSTWTADPAAGRVHVLTNVTATSHTVDAADRRYYYDRIQLTLPASSTGFEATAAGAKNLPITVESDTPSKAVVVVGLAQRLYSGQSGSFDLQFDLVDPGGSTDRDLRIGHNLISFPVSAFGSPNTPGSSVTVVFPSDFTVQEEFGGLTRSVFGSGEVVFSSGIIDDSTAFGAWFTAVQPVAPADYAVRSMTIGPLTVTLRYWSDDVGWANQVESVLRAGYPILRDMIGLGDPIGTKLAVEEASTQEINGFSGAYDQTSGQVRISYFADPFVILHEAAHMWFNSDLVSDRWIQEGFASYYAQQAVDRLVLTDHAPLLTDRMRQASVPLNDWVTAVEPSSATDAYLYGASLEVARQIAAEAGQGGLRTVWSDVRAGKAAYQPLHGAQTEASAGGATDWRRLLDLLEQTTGDSYAGIWRLWVMDPSQIPLLQQRDTALTAYADLENLAGTWDVPPEIRGSLDGWEYEQAIAFMGQARGILAQRDQIAIEAANEQTTPPPALQVAFEHSGNAVASAEATNELTVLGELSAARQARTDSGGAARVVGLLGTDPQADLASARDAFAKGDLSRALSLALRARTAWQSANGTGQMRIFGGLSVLAGALLLFVLFLWSRRSDSGEVATTGAPVGREAIPAGRLPSVGRATPSRRRSTKGAPAAAADATAGATTDATAGATTPQV